MKNIYQRLLDELKKERPLVLATIVATEGSSPQVPGVSALFSADGLLVGTLGGGVLEARAQEKALDSLEKGDSCLTKFGLYADITSTDEAICGGEAYILFDVKPQEHKETFSLMIESLSNRHPGVLVNVISRMRDDRTKISRSWIEKNEIIGEEAEKQDMPLQGEIKEAFEAGKPVFMSLKKKTEGKGTKGEADHKNLLYLEPLYPLSHLIIAGAGHVGQAVAHLGSLLDFEVTVIDDRLEFANRERLPEVDHIITEDIGEALTNLPKTEDSYFVIVTRGHSHDAEALKACIDSDVAYIGMIGSARKIALMRKNFLDQDWATPSQFDRVHAPIGIDIQSKTVQEIAVSICAELILIRNKVQGKSEEST
jgi:xanthine dehydrogenase accessory factor